MALVRAICTQCGAKIETDNTKEAGICEYCGSAFITEKAINNYVTNITNNNFDGATINIVGADIEDLLNLSEEAFQAGNKEEALSYNGCFSLRANDIRACNKDGSNSTAVDRKY